MELAPILLVEDDDNDVLLFRRAATRARLQNPIEVVSNGEEAIDRLSRLTDAASDATQPTPVVVLLDLKMPRKSGFEVLEWVRQQPGLEGLPVVVFSASGQDPDVRRAHDLGASSYLVKPVTFEALAGLTRTLGLSWGLYPRHSGDRSG